MESPLVGRAAERAAIADTLAAWRARPGGVVAIEGEPGIGKSRLLAHIADAAHGAAAVAQGAGASAGGATVLHARASEFEHDLPHALWTEALGGHLAALGERRLSRLGLADPDALAAMLPVLGDASATDRHRTHRALRDLLERLAATAPLVLCLDDVHWADPASVDALAALIRRPPAGPVLLAWAAREGQIPAPLVAAMAAALREERGTALALAPLSESEAAELVGAAAASIYPQAGGNPFYLEQLARVAGGARAAALAGDGSVPPMVAAALSSELAELSPEARQLLDAAAVAGDPFDADLAAEVAGLSEPAALDALDELLGRAIARPDAAPRRFAFRHPVVRHAVYEAIPGGRRLGAHGRAAAALERRGAGVVQQAHHVEHAARVGDADAIALLTTAAEELHSPAPATAARFYAAALRLAPESAPAPTRMQSRGAAARDPEGARQTLLDALETAAPGDRLALIVSLANQEWWLGGHVDALRRLHVALGELPAQPSPDRIRLRLALALTALMACDLPEAQAHASDASDDARAIGDPVFEVAGLAAGALAYASDAAGDRIAESAAALDRLTDAQVATRLPALWMHGRARRALGRFDEALADLERAAAIATRTGRERVLLVVTVESVATLIELGRLADAAAAGEEGVELARLAGNPRMLLWAHSALSRARLTMGDVDAALRHAQEAADAGMEADFHAAGQPGWCLGAALTAVGNPERAVDALLEGLGGEDLPRVLPVDRPAAGAELVEARLACGDVAGAERAMARAEHAADQAGTRWAGAVAGIGRAAVLLTTGRADDAVKAAAAARESAAPATATARDAAAPAAPPAAAAPLLPAAPLAAARALLLQGRALAAAGRRLEAIEVLIAAEAELDGFGAARLRGEAARELRQLGHRVVRPARDAEAGPLTAREREIADLVAAGRTNREIAAQLVLSTRTIEAHLRNIFAKLGVRSRVELARAGAGHSAAGGADGSGS
jgi:ATP/maltotriose-dependent transcriptional regulator MalT